MFDIWMAIYVGVLFVLLTPDVLVCIPKRSSSLTSAIVHGIIFALIYLFTYKFVANMIHKNVEGYEGSIPGIPGMPSMPSKKK
jgi:hypothetical protein